MNELKIIFNRILFGFLILCLLLTLIISTEKQLGLGDFNKFSNQNIFWLLVMGYELPHLAIFSITLCLFLIITAGLLRLNWPKIKLTKCQVYFFAAMTTILVGLCRHYFYLDDDLCVDETLPKFQSEIFAHLDLVGKIPLEWRDFTHALKCFFIMSDSKNGYWMSGFLPIHSLLRTPAAIFNVDGYMNAILLGINILLFYKLLSRLWPHLPSYSAIGIFLLVASNQIFIMSMTSFAMESNLLFTTVWLLLYTSRNNFFFLLTPWWGILSIGVHQPHIHLLTAAPFVCRFARNKKWFDFFYFILTYCLGITFWALYLFCTRTSVTGNGYFTIFEISQLLIQPCNVALLLTWLPSCLFPLIGILLFSGCRIPDFVADSLLSAAIFFIFYMAWPYTQSAGWGYRFMYPSILFLIIGALQGLSILRLALQDRNLCMSIIAIPIVVAAVQLCFRFTEVLSIVKPHKEVTSLINSSKTSIVLFDPTCFWYGSDFIINNPYLNNIPIIINLSTLNPALISDIKKRHITYTIISPEIPKQPPLPYIPKQEMD